MSARFEWTSEVFALRARVLMLLSDVMTAVNAHAPCWENLNDPLALGPVTRGLDPYVVHEATGFGAKRVYRLEVIELAIFPVQLPVELSVYVALRFMKRPEVMGMGFVTFATEMFAVAMLAEPMLAVTRFE